MDYYQKDLNNNDNNENTPLNNSFNQPPRQRNTLATASLIFGILAFCSTVTVWFGIIFGVVAIVLAIISRNNTNGQFKGVSVGGLALGILAIIISLLLFFAALQMLQNPEMMQYFNDYLQQSGYDNGTI